MKFTWWNTLSSTQWSRYSLRKCWMSDPKTSLNSLGPSLTGRESMIELDQSYAQLWRQSKSMSESKIAEMLSLTHSLKYSDHSFNLNLIRDSSGIVLLWNSSQRKDAQAPQRRLSFSLDSALAISSINWGPLHRDLILVLPTSLSQP